MPQRKNTFKSFPWASDVNSKYRITKMVIILSSKCKHIHILILTLHLFPQICGDFKPNQSVETDVLYLWCSIILHWSCLCIALSFKNKQKKNWLQLLHKSAHNLHSSYKINDNSSCFCPMRYRLLSLTAELLKSQSKRIFRWSGKNCEQEAIKQNEIKVNVEACGSFHSFWCLISTCISFF